MPETRTYDDWKIATLKEYKDRTGITWKDGGNTEQDLRSYYREHSSPREVVDYLIDKYGMIDITKNNW